MQIGQILVEQRWVDPQALADALAAQPGAGLRICSLLIARGRLDPDHAARALAHQHNVPGVLQKHLDNRERALAILLPAAFARAHLALPIGRTRDHELIVCVRDPSPALGAVIAAAVAGRVLIAVAPAHQLEQLVAATYDAPDPDEIEVDLRTQRVPVIGDGLADLGSMTLVQLDDYRVARDPSQSGQHAAVLARTLTAPGVSAPVRATLDTSIAAIDRSTRFDDAIDAAMRHLAGRCAHAVLFAIREGAACGVRGHGERLTAERVATLAVPLGAPSIVQEARDTRRPVTASPRHIGAVQDRLANSLGSPRALIAVPIEVGPEVAYVIAAGDPFDAAATRELERLAGALGAAFERLVEAPRRPPRPR
jgi:hypothetical protein